MSAMGQCGQAGDCWQGETEMLELQRIPGPYHDAAFLASWAERHATGTRPYVAVMPDSSARAIASKATLEDRTTVPVGSLLWAISAVSDQAAGFSLQITDVTTKKPLFNQLVHAENASGHGSVTVLDSGGGDQVIATPLHVLPKPLVIMPPGLVGVQITNLAVAVNTLQLCLHFICPDGESKTQLLSRHNLEVATAVALAQRAVREPTSGQKAQDAVMNHVPFSVTALGDNTILAGSPGARITIYELDIWNVAQQTITLMDGPDRLRGPLTNFPAQMGRTWDDNGKPHFQLTAGRSFILNLSGATEVSGYVRYKME